MSFDQRLIRLSAIIVMSIAALATSACVGTPASVYEGRIEAQCPIEPTQASGTIRVGYQIILGTELYVRDRGLAEACMPNARVEWIRFPTGQDVVKGLASDSIDVGILGSTPTAKALSSPLNLDVVVPRVNAVIGSSEALVAKDESVRTAADLRGARIAVPFSSTSHYSLLNALRGAGLDPKRDVELVNLSPDNLPAAWQSSRIDAAYVWDPVLSDIASSGHRVLTSANVAEAGAPTYNFTLAARPWTESNPELLATWLKVQEWSQEKGRSDPQEFAEGNANQAQLAVDEALQQMNGLNYVSADEQADQLRSAVQALQETSAFLTSEGEVSAPLSPEKATSAVLIPEDDEGARP